VKLIRQTSSRAGLYAPPAELYCAAVNIRINGKDAVILGGQSLEDVLTSRTFDLAAVVVEVNGRIVPRDQWTTLSLTEGDRLEVVSFVGGG